jgi:hypothetical protein
MAEPGLGAIGVAVSTATGVAATAVLPGLDMNAVIGAFAGSLMFVVFARDLNHWRRIGYGLVSWIAGYYFSAELAAVWTARSSGAASFVSAALVVTVSITILEWLSGGRMPGWLRWLLDRRGGDNNG